MGSNSAAGRSGRRGRSTKAAANSARHRAVKQEEEMAEQEKTSTNGDGSKDTSTKSGKLDLAKKSEENGGQSGSGLAVRAEATEGQGALQPMGSLANRPVGTGAIEVAESFYSAGLRPIAASHMDVFAMILNDRPIMASHLHVVDFGYPGQRPVFASDIVVRDDLALPGGRPIVASDPKLLEASLLPGGRPIASNEIDDSETLMGFID